MAPGKSGSAQWRNGARTRSNPHPLPLTRKSHPYTTSNLWPSNREALGPEFGRRPAMGEARAAGEVPFCGAPVAGPRVERWQLGAVLSFMNFWYLEGWGDKGRFRGCEMCCCLGRAWTSADRGAPWRFVVSCFFYVFLLRDDGFWWLKAVWWVHVWYFLYICIFLIFLIALLQYFFWSG